MKLLLLFSCIITAVVGVHVTGHRGKTLQITCSYKSGYETYKKYLCKGQCIVGFKDIIVESGFPAKDKRFSLNDDTTARVFTVTITDLRTDDEGKYWCGIQIPLCKQKATWSNQPHGPTHPVPFTQSYFSTSGLNLQSTRIKHKDQSLSSTAASVVYVSVGLTLMLIGLLVALTVLRKKKKRGKKSQRVAQSGPSDQVSAVNTLQESTAEDFEHEYQDIRELQPKNVNSTITVYSTVQGSANSTIYSTTERPVDSVIYSTAKAPAGTTT
ncbi:CMRF35-like molecule 8 [Triplophysa dalaica]|uniref:CMRF35-like molecule 8 n=1 Tax=Triplophysa dalaica TaxID=1582913 RepID=UPI0024DF733A|nr:CMRF35-like molecule 8 [Triplophysa dalaica]